MIRILLCLSVLLCGCESLVVIRGPNRNTNEVKIEVDWTTTTPPPSSILEGVRDQIKLYCDPSVQVKIITDNAGGPKIKWSTLDLESFALLNRRFGSDDFYLIWADGQFESEPTVGGYSWGNRCLAVFPAAIPGTYLQQLSITHEFFHNIGLVDKSLEMQIPHKHGYGNHCDQPGCLMFPIAGGGVLCSRCIADLEAGEEK